MFHHSACPFSSVTPSVDVLSPSESSSSPCPSRPCHRSPLIPPGLVTRVGTHITFPSTSSRRLTSSSTTRLPSSLFPSSVLGPNLPSLNPHHPTCNPLSILYLPLPSLSQSVRTPPGPIRADALSPAQSLTHTLFDSLHISPPIPAQRPAEIHPPELEHGAECANFPSNSG